MSEPALSTAPVIDDTAAPAPPPPQKDRIRLLDAARGLAILGILPCNMPDFAYPLGVGEAVRSWPHGTGWATLAGWAVTQIFFQRKFVSLFSMMFGVSVFLVGGERSDKGRGSILRKRLLWLLLIGLVHCFAIWWGDVLVTYALGGLILLLMRSWSPRKLLITGVIIWIAFNTLVAAGTIASAFMKQPDVAKNIASNLKHIAEYQGHGVLGSLLANAKDGLNAQMGQPFIVTSLLGLMCIGLAAYKWGVFTGEARRGAYWALLGGGMLALAVVGVSMGSELAWGIPPATGPLIGWMQMLLAPLTSLGYVAALYFAVTSKLFRFIPNVLAPVGQMAFTNYLTQSILMTALFYPGRGPGLYGQVDRPGLWAICIAVWVLQIIWSHLWLQHFTMGPLEWAWRRLYRGSTPLRRSASAGALVAA